VLPDLFREGQGVIAEARSTASAYSMLTRFLAKHDETYMPKEVADALKKSGHWKDDYAQRAALPLAEQPSDSGTRPICLMLALGLSLIQATVPIVGTRTNDPVLMNIASASVGRAIRFRGNRVRRACRMLRRVRFLSAQWSMRIPIRRCH